MKEQIKITKEKWLERGRELFGEDPLKWQFVCPMCGHIQTPEDFRQFKDRSAKPEYAYFNCIGRFTDGKSCFDKTKDGPCDYTSGGLFCFAPIVVIDGSCETPVFAFNEASELKGESNLKPEADSDETSG